MDEESLVFRQLAMNHSYSATAGHLLQCEAHGEDAIYIYIYMKLESTMVHDIHSLFSYCAR